ncbi:hypothetical protein [Bacillus thuringiensis]|uniref:hypothetical protein n=1 Tax=Bacillus cereus group TaxID=86661 RepID=UPI000BF4CCB3|nr:hypothetical protein [Bacillus thuringiensis]MRA82472.1 hypothetical protein [Bacillus thuringiensis]PES54395.1 hypothetical protein CN506_20180 [Bacillus thuringiensis]
MFEELIDKFDDLKDDNPLLAYFIAGAITAAIIYILYTFSTLGWIVLAIVVLMVIGWIVVSVIDFIMW